MAARHIKDDNEKPLAHHDDGLGHEDGGFAARTRSEGQDSVIEPMVTPGAKWEKKTIWKIDLRLLIIRTPAAFVQTPSHRRLTIV